MKRYLLWAIAVLLTGCATQRSPMLPAPLTLPKSVQEYSTIAPSARNQASTTQVSATPAPPAAELTSTVKALPHKANGEPEKADITLAVEQMPLLSFIQLVYGTILKRNVSIDPAVAARQDLVTVHTGVPQTATEVADTARMLLKTYGITVVDLGNLVRVVPDNKQLGYLPEIRRGRALPETPLPLRPIFQLVELQAVRTTDVARWLGTMFGSRVHVMEDAHRDAIWLEGEPGDVIAAMEAVHVLDQPLMKGRHSVRITPIFLSAGELTKKLTQILQTEGYSAGPPSTAITQPVTLVPVPAVNAVFAFAADQAILDHVVAWAKELDKPGANGIGRTLFTYHVKYTDAEALAKTLEQILGGVPAPKAHGAAAKPLSSRVVVDKTSNTIIFQGSNEDYGQIKGILEMLDRPSKEALIEVTVAELDLTKNSQLGIEWLINQANLSGSSVTAGTLGGLGIGSSGFNFRTVNGAGNRQLLLNALASNNRATVLSSPRVMARNGETATIQVGQEVPIVTSQQTIPVANSAPSVVQSVQYMNTGVILKVRPVIHSGSEIDLDISQEVSSAQNTTTGVNSSPTISKRAINTKLSVSNGSTVLLGGLISSNGSQGNAGIPVLKDIPGIGQLFRTNTNTSDRTELIVLITPYIISNNSDAKAVTAAFRRQLGSWAESAAAQLPPKSGAPAKAEDKHAGQE